MKFSALPLRGAYTIDLQKLADDRGFFSRLWCSKELSEFGLDTKIVQINNSQSKSKGTLRGLHFQYPPKAETKIVRCINGAIWDVIVDIRKSSKTYGQWFGMELSEENRTMVYVPKGFAHGFISLMDYSEIIYLVSEEYSTSHEGTLHWNDPFHGIDWPIEPKIISDKDRQANKWEDHFAVKL
jgi:dTDP-4-dehydrorhamnose 3,5-epimerase